MAKARENLQDERVSSPYKSVLAGGYRELCDWAAVEHRAGPQELSKDYDALNDLLIDYIQSCYDRNIPISRARCAVLGVQHNHRNTVRQLKASWDSIKSWEQKRPLRLRVPCPELIARAMFLSALLKGFCSDPDRSQQWIPFAIVLWVCWVGMLRPGEAIGLRGEDVVLPSPLHASLCNSAIVRILNPKNRRQLGKSQVSKIDDALATRWLECLLTGMTPELKLFPGSLATYRSMFNQLCRELHVEHLGLTPASMRAGHATALFVAGMETSRLRVMGRWRCLESLDHYVQIASSALTVLKVNPVTLRELEYFCAQESVFSQPPVGAWTAFFSRSPQLRAHLQWTRRRSLRPFAKRRPLRR